MSPAPRPDEAVTIVARRRVRAGRERDYERWLERLVGLASGRDQRRRSSGIRATVRDRRATTREAMSADDVVTVELVHAIAPGAGSFVVRRLPGGVSAETYAVELASGGPVERWVVRHCPTATRKGALSVAQEFGLLSALHAAGVRVPRPLMHRAPDTMVMAWVEGTTELPSGGPSLMAEALAGIHGLRGAPLLGLPEREEPVIDAVEGLDGERLATMVRALAASEKCLLHGDFWPGNVLWRDGAIAAILDWEDAAVGDPLSDVACARVEIEVAAGPEAAHAFTERYLEVTGRDPVHLAIWDVYVATAALASMDTWGLPADVLEHRRTVTRAFRDREIVVLRREARS